MTPVLIVAEDSRAAAKQLVGDAYDVISYLEVTESGLSEKNVLYWPTAGEKGVKARSLAYAKQSKELKRISTVGQPKGFNAAVALKDGWTFAKLVDWAKPRAEVIPFISELVEESPPTDSQYARLEKAGLAMTKDGKPICNAANVVRLLKNDPTYAGHIWHDTFTNETLSDLDGLVRPWTDSKTTALMIRLQDDLGMHRVTSSMVHDAIGYFADSDSRHQVRDWLKSLVWDGEERLHGFFTSYMGADPSISIGAFGKNFWVLMVKRAMRPGCQADYMVVLEGSQGIGKTRAMQVIGGKWYAEVGITADSEDFERQLQGKLLVEIAELNSFTKSDQSRIKQIITKRVDRYREKYGRTALDHPRSCILVGTTNESEWIKDQTGGRRFWPVKCGRIDFEALKKDREQLFAEALWRLDEGDEGYIVPEEETKALQDERRESHPWEEALETELRGRESVTLNDAMTYLKIPVERMNSASGKTVAHILRRLGFSAKVSRIQGELKRIWNKEGVTEL